MKWVLIILALAYLLNPFDLLPDVVVGAGWLDDLAVLGTLGYLAYRMGYRGFPFSSGARSEKADTDQPPSASGAESADDPRMILGVGPDAGPREIRQAYRHLASQYHPDKVAHLGEEFRRLAEEKFRAIQAAYEALNRS